MKRQYFIFFTVIFSMILSFDSSARKWGKKLRKIKAKHTYTDCFPIATGKTFSFENTKKAIKKVDGRLGHVIEESDRMPLDLVKIIFCSKNSKLVETGWCRDTKNKVMICTSISEGVNCQIISRHGDDADAAISLHEMEQQWEEALSWLRKTELQEFLNSMEFNLDEYYRNSSEEKKSREIFRESAIKDFKKVQKQSKQGTQITGTPQQQAELFMSIKGLQASAKGTNPGFFKPYKN